MSQPNFTWTQIIDAANSFLSNDFVSGVLIAVCALSIVGLIADFLRRLAETWGS